MPLPLTRLRAYDVYFALSFLFFLMLTILLCTYGRMFILECDYPRAMGEYHLMMDQCLDGKRIIVGDSVTRDGINPRILGDDILNVSLGASNAIELYFELKAMRWCKTPPKEVYISISPHHFIYDDGYWTNSVRYGLLSQDDMREVRDDSRLLSNDVIYDQGKTPIERKISYWLKEHHAPTLYFPSIRNTLLNFRYHENVLVYNRVLENQGYSSFEPYLVQPPFPNKPLPTELSLEATDKDFIPNPLISLYFDKMLQLLEDEHINVVYFSMPISDLSKAAMTKEYAANYEVFLTQSLARHKNVRLVGEIFPTMPIRYFNDHSHMHERGAYEWTEIIKPVLNGAVQSSHNSIHSED